MPRAPASPAKPLDWSPPARRAYLETIALIAAEDPHSAKAFAERIDQALARISAFPSIGTPLARRGERRFPIAGTGHVVNYKVLRRRIRIQRWYRARRLAES